MINRYKIDARFHNGEIQSPTGDFVKFKDVSKIIVEIKEEHIEVYEKMKQDHIAQLKEVLKMLEGVGPVSFDQADKVVKIIGHINKIIGENI